MNKGVDRQAQSCSDRFNLVQSCSILIFFHCTEGHYFFAFGHGSRCGPLILTFSKFYLYNRLWNLNRYKFHRRCMFSTKSSLAVHQEIFQKSHSSPLEFPQESPKVLLEVFLSSPEGPWSWIPTWIPWALLSPPESPSVPKILCEFPWSSLELDFHLSFEFPEFSRFFWDSNRNFKDKSSLTIS